MVLPLFWLMMPTIMTESPPNTEAEARVGEIITRATLTMREDAATVLAKRPRSQTHILKLCERALAMAEATIDSVLVEIPPPVPVACEKGCPYCCHIRVTASVPEILLVLAHLRKTLNTEKLAALKQKVANIDSLTRDLDDDGRAKLRLPCPLQKDNACSVHAVRPLSCRALASTDVAACKQAYKTAMQTPVPQLEWQRQGANAIGYGLYAGMADAGFAIENAELVAALKLGLDDGEIGKKWLGGQGVFAAACNIRRDMI